MSRIADLGPKLVRIVNMDESTTEANLKNLLQTLFNLKGDIKQLYIKKDEEFGLIFGYVIFEWSCDAEMITQRLNGFRYATERLEVALIGPNEKYKVYRKYYLNADIENQESVKNVKQVVIPSLTDIPIIQPARRLVIPDPVAHRNLQRPAFITGTNTSAVSSKSTIDRKNKLFVNRPRVSDRNSRIIFPPQKLANNSKTSDISSTQNYIPRRYTNTLSTPSESTNLNITKVTPSNNNSHTYRNISSKATSPSASLVNGPNNSKTTDISPIQCFQQTFPTAPIVYRNTLPIATPLTPSKSTNVITPKITSSNSNFNTDRNVLTSTVKSPSATPLTPSKSTNVITPKITSSNNNFNTDRNVLTSTVTSPSAFLVNQPFFSTKITPTSSDVSTSDYSYRNSIVHPVNQSAPNSTTSATSYNRSPGLTNKNNQFINFSNKNNVKVKKEDKCVIA